MWCQGSFVLLRCFVVAPTRNDDDDAAAIMMMMILLMMLMLRPLAVTSGVTNIRAYHRPSDGHFWWGSESDVVGSSGLWEVANGAGIKLH